MKYGIKRIYLILIMMTGLTMVGTFGYAFLEGWSFLDSFYMTIITLTTTGYMEVKPLGDSGRLFTIFLLMFGMGIIAYSVTSLAEFIVNIDFDKRRREKMENRISKLKEHVVVCGFGRMGKVLCARLYEQNIPFVVLENKPETVKELEKTNYYWLEADATSDEGLQAASITFANILVSMIDSDAEALYLCLSAKNLNPHIKVIARASDETAKKRMLRAGANKVFLPIVMSGLKVAEAVLNPAVEDFLDITSANMDKTRIQLADLIVNAKSSLVGKSLREKGPEMRELIVVGVRKPDKSFIFYPKADYVFGPQDCLITMGTKEAYDEALIKFELTSRTF